MMQDTLIINKNKTAEICAITATNRQILINCADAFIEYLRDSNYDVPENVSYLHIELFPKMSGCIGGSLDCKTRDDVPQHSVPCPCGNPTHWLIKYDE